MQRTIHHLSHPLAQTPLLSIPLLLGLYTEVDMWVERLRMSEPLGVVEGVVALTFHLPLEEESDIMMVSRNYILS